MKDWKLVENETNGYVIPHSDYNALNEAFIKVLECKKNVKIMGENSRKIYQKYLINRKTNIEEFKNIFREL